MPEICVARRGVTRLIGHVNNRRTWDRELGRRAANRPSPTAAFEDRTCQRLAIARLERKGHPPTQPFAPRRMARRARETQ